jgi:pyruvate-ferredoxin/flavodoxin oxidoreductase
MVQETEQVNAEHETGTAFLNLLPDTPQKYLGLYNDTHPDESKTAALRNLLMVRRNYDALVAGDGACAGCGEKSILKAITSVTEAYMRPIYHAKANRMRTKAGDLEKVGVQKLAELKARNPQEYELLRQAIAHLVMGLGGEDEKDTKKRIAAHGEITDGDLVHSIATVMLQEAFNHMNLQAIDGHGGAHWLQHRVWINAFEQPAPVSVDEFALPGRRHRWLAAGREFHCGSCPPFRCSGASGRCPDAAHGERDQRSRIL